VSKSRAELNADAAAAGVAEPEKLKNRQAVVDAIAAAASPSEQAVAGSDHEEELS
jgi:hypothetical protein